MDESEVTQQEQEEQSGMQVVPNAGQMGYAAYQNAVMGASGTSGVTAPVPPQPPMFPHPAHQLGFQPTPQFQHPHQQQQQQQLQMFWANQMQEIEQNADFKNHSLPLARIKKIMKADEDVRMISAEAPVIFAKACEMFIMELTLRSWIYTEENKRRTLQKNDIAAAISRTDVFDFLVDIVPRDELREDGLGVPKVNMPMRGSPSDMPFYCVPPPQYPMGGHAAGMGMGHPGEYPAAMFAAQHPRPSLPYMPWPQTQSQPLPPEDQDEEHKETDN